MHVQLSGLPGARRGRAERSSFAESFSTAYHFRLLFLSSLQLFPILGACRRAFPGPWEVRHLTRLAGLLSSTPCSDVLGLAVHPACTVWELLRQAKQAAGCSAPGPW